MIDLATESIYAYHALMKTDRARAALIARPNPSRRPRCPRRANVQAGGRDGCRSP
jgi:hypothetical protein